MAAPITSLGGRVQPKPPKIPKVPKMKAPKPLTLDQTANRNAMSAFRTALAQLQASTPQVDQNAIYAPYRASQQVTGQLGQGLQTAVTNAGQAAQSQYGAGLAEAQKTAAQFGISAGAGAAPTALQNTGTQLIAQQTQAQAAAAPMAATAWQQLLERTAGAKVADANLNRQNSLTSAEQSLAGGLPAAIQNEKQLGFQQDTAKKNFALAVGTAKDKQTNDLRDYLLGVTKAQTSASTAAANTSVKQASLAQKTANDKAKLRVSRDTLALKQRAATATATGLKGIAAATKALTGTTSKAGTKQVAKGWDVKVQPWDENLGQAVGSPTTIHVADKRKIPKGYHALGTATTHWEKVPTSAGSAGLTASAWDVQMRSLLAQNPGQGAAIKAFLGPRPKK